MEFILYFQADPSLPSFFCRICLTIRADFEHVGPKIGIISVRLIRVERFPRSPEPDHPRPVDPMPPSPRAVSPSVSTLSHSARSKRATTSWAIRSPGLISNGSSDRFDQNRLDLAPVVGIDRARRVRERDAVSGGQTAARAYLNLVSVRNLDVKSGRYQRPFQRAQHDAFADVGPHVHAGGSGGFILRQGVCRAIDDFDFHGFFHLRKTRKRILGRSRRSAPLPRSGRESSVGRGA